MEFNDSMVPTQDPNDTQVTQNSSGRPLYLSQSLGVLITKYVFLALLEFFGIAGNILVVVVMTKRKVFQSSLDLFIKNLAIADLGFLLLVSPPGVLRIEMPWHWPLGKVVCLYIYPFVDIFHGASVWIIAVIAVERYRNIVGMVRIRRQTQIKRSLKYFMVGVWMFSFVFFCIPVYTGIAFYQNDQATICTLRWSRSQKDSQVGTNVYLLFMVLVSYVIPLGVITWTYFAISRQLHRSNTFLRNIKGIIFHRKTAKNFIQIGKSLQNYRNESNLTANGEQFQNNSLNSLVDSRRPTQNRRTKNILTPVVALSVNGKQSQNNSLTSLAESHRLTQNKRAKNILTPVAVLFAVSMLPISLLRIILIFWKEIILENYYNVVFFLTVVFTTANSSLNPLVYSVVSREFRTALKSLFRKKRKPRAIYKGSVCTFEGQEWTEHKRIDHSEAPAAKDCEGSTIINLVNTRAYTANDTKL